MYITISEENRIVLEELREEAIQIKQEAKELSISLLIQLKTFMFQFILSYKEYSLTNIREYGLAEILMNRANRFFKLDQSNEEPRKPKEKSKFRYRTKRKNTVDKAGSQTRIFDNTHVSARNITRNQSRIKSKKGYKYIVKRIFKVILFPFYILILILGMLLGSKSNEKPKKNVKNTYSPY